MPESLESQETNAASRQRFGPGLIVAAAFIGPGTVFTASRAGAEHGFGLLWAIVFSVIGAITLQQMAARLGILTGFGLGEYLNRWLAHSPWRRPTIALVLLAIGLGNAFYQTGNLTGAATGLATIVPGPVPLWVTVLSALTAILLMLGSYKVLHTTLIALVAFLSLAFFLAAFSSTPDWSLLVKGLVPTPSAQNLAVVVGLIGTTIVPYNLFLHASGAAETWKDCEPARALVLSRWDTVLSISLGGLITASIMISAASAFHLQGREMGSIGQIAEQLEPTLGGLSSVAFAIGLFAAGLTSSITAPLATGYAVCGVMNWPNSPTSTHFRFISLAVVLLATTFVLLFGKAPGQTIFVAQVANGLLLPIIAFVVLLAAWQDSRKPMSIFQKCAGLTVVGLVTVLAFWKLFQLLWT